MANKQHTKACSACPWRKDSTRGWLGASTPVEFLQQSEAGIKMPCHSTIDYEKPDWETDVISAPHCAGRLAHMRNRCKGTEPGMPKVETDTNVFSNPQDFINHHTIDGDPPKIMIIGTRVFET